MVELFCEAMTCGSHFLIRHCNDRRIGDGTTTLDAEIARLPCMDLHRIAVPDAHGRLHSVLLELRYQPPWVRPPIGKEKRYPPVLLTALRATER